MKKFFYGLAIWLGLAGFLSVALPAHALDIEISTGDPEGSYSKFINQAAQICNNDKYTYKILSSAGSPMNLDRLLANEVPAGVAQLDVGDLYRTTKDVSNLRVLIPLFPEQAHFIVRKGFSRKEIKTVGGFQVKIGNWTPGADDQPVQSVSELAGFRVAAVGGSAYTGQMLRHPNVGNLQIQLNDTYPSAKATVEAVLKGEADAALVVSAAPAGVLTAVKDQQANLRLLPIDDALMGRLNKFYPTRASLSYQGMGTGGTNISTFQVMSALLVPNYTKGPFVGALSHLRKCILDNAEDMASVPKTHVAWRFIANGQGKVTGDWQVWNDPAQGTSITPVKKK